MPRKSTTQKISNEAIAQYLTADLESMTQRAIQYENLLANKINFYLAIVTAAIGGLVLTAGISEVKPFLLVISCLMLLILSVMGSVTILQGLDLNANSIFMYRRMGRVRQWFLDQESSLYPYMPFAPGDDQPSYYVADARLRSTEAILYIVNAVVIAAFGVLMWLFFSLQVFQIHFEPSLTPYLVAVGIGIIIFTAAFTIEFGYAQKYMRYREEVEKKQMRINFPSAKIREKFEKRKK